MTIRREDERLLREAPGYLPVEMFPETPTRFFIKDDPARISFHKDERGQIEHLTAAMSGSEREPDHQTKLVAARTQRYAGNNRGDDGKRGHARRA